MTTLLELKEIFRSLYTKAAPFIRGGIKFLIAVAVLMILNIQLGYMDALNNIGIVLVCSILCAFLPYSFMCFVAAAFLLGHMFALSMYLAAGGAIVLIIIMLIYNLFSPGYCMILILTPLLFCLKIPYLMPLVLGLMQPAVTFIPMCFGVSIYYMFEFTANNAALFAESSSLTTIEQCLQLFYYLKENKMMILMLFAMVIGGVACRVLRRASFRFSFESAVSVGALLQVIIIFLGIYVADVSISMTSLLGVLLWAVLSGLIAEVINFMFIGADYSGVEYAQFEDDDSIYYVRVVPKMSVTRQEVKVKKINSSKADESAAEDEADKDEAVDEVTDEEV